MDSLNGSHVVPVQVISQNLRDTFFPGVSSLAVLRLDLPDPVVGGNKRYKLKYNLQDFRSSGSKSILTFGGAYSNHLAATAAACEQESISCIGIVRGDELNASSNRVLEFAASRGMQLDFVSRETYLKRNEQAFHEQLQVQYGNVFILPEGGSNARAVKGCTEILNSECSGYDDIICPVGTGATLAGIILSAQPHQKVTGIAILEGEDYVRGLVASFVNEHSPAVQWEIDSGHTLGGYAKSDDQLKIFNEEMFTQCQLPLDHIYSGKTLFAIHKMAVNGVFLNRKVLFIHTGGYAFTTGK